ncbi:MAG: trypsin-like peptidase domain-containing protein [Dehalococcoidia bacterium]|nr:trypsin-like peptidase domain-containing protein [Dehalococcoidia bacterium]
MNMLNNLKNLFIRGLVSLTLVAVIACSNSTESTKSLTATEESTQQITNVALSTVIPTVIPTPTESADSVTEVNPTESSESYDQPIQAAFVGGPDKTPIGDAIPEVPEQAPEVVQLTPAEIVAVQEDHLANLYEDTVQSVVFIVTSSTQGVGSGSGFVWDENGHIVTNYHVIQGASLVTVKFFNGREYRADVVAFDPAADLAVIKLIDVEHDLIPIKIGTSSGLRPGQTAIALGNPFGEEFTMTTGIVSAVTRTIKSGFSTYNIPAVIQTDASINPGNSGGPLLDKEGAVIGVNTQIVSETRQSSGVGFAVPVDLVSRVIPSLIELREYTYPLMGISGMEVDLEVRENAALNGGVVGAYVSGVTPNGPADTAGIRGDSTAQFNVLAYDGDVIVSINSTRMNSMDDLIGYLALNTAPGDDIVVGVLRNGVEIAIPLTLGARPQVS